MALINSWVTDVGQSGSPSNRQQTSVSAFCSASYAMDIERHIDWSGLDLTGLLALPLSEYRPTGESFAVGLAKNGQEVIESHDVQRLAPSARGLDPFYLARVLSDDLIPNPWVANSVTEDILDGLQAKYGGDMVASGFVYIVEQAKQYIQAEKDRLAKLTFEASLDKDDSMYITLALESKLARINGMPNLARRKAKFQIGDETVFEVESVRGESRSTVEFLASAIWQIRKSIADGALPCDFLEFTSSVMVETPDRNNFIEYTGEDIRRMEAMENRQPTTMVAQHVKNMRNRAAILRLDA